MHCREIMKKDVESVLPADTVRDAAKKMRDENIGFLPICDESGKVQGTITDRDLAIRVLADARSATTRVEEVMTRQVVSCQPEDDVTDAEKLMSKNQKSRIVCVDAAGQLVGVISLSDLAQIDDAEASRTLREVSEREARA